MEDPVPRRVLPLELPPFSHDGYRRLIKSFLGAGYLPATFDNVRPAARDVIIRHDVDVSLEAAVNIAELEHQMGIRATYFVMVSNSFYNLYSAEGRRLVGRLEELGHQIGLHFDPVAYPPDESLADYCKAVADEFRLLASVVRDPIEIISFHNPRRELVNREPPPGSPPHTYEPRFFADLTYVPDSGGQWRFGGPFERPAFKTGTAIHLLTHPIWWDHDEPTAGPEQTLQKFATAQTARLHEKLAGGFRAYRELLSRSGLGGEE